MGKTSTVQEWNILEIGVEENDKEEVTSIFRKICREFYASNNADLNKLNGAVKQVVLNWISGSKTIKKSNVLDHPKAHHQSVIQILKERAAEKSESPQITEVEKLASSITAPSNSETSILNHFQQLNLRQREQLLKKFQLAYFIVQNNLAFTKYEKFPHLKKEFHKVSSHVLVFLMIRAVLELLFSYQIQQSEKML